MNKIITVKLLVFLFLVQSPVLAWDKWGYIDRNGRGIIDGQYRWAGSFDGGYALVQPYGVPDKFRLPYPETLLIDRSNKQLQKARVTASFGLVKTKQGALFGFSSLDGLKSIRPQFEEATNFIHGLALVKPKLSSWRVIDVRGQIVKEIPSDWTLLTKEPCLAFLSPDGFRHDFTGQSSTTDDVIGFQTMAGGAGSFSNYVITNYFCDGLTAARDKEGKWCYVDKQGVKRITLPGSCIEAQDFSDGLAAVVVAQEKQSPPTFGFIDADGKFVIPPKFPYIHGLESRLIDGLALATSKSNEQFLFGFVDRHGQFIIPPKYLQAKNFSDNLAAVDMSPITFDPGDWKYERKNNPNLPRYLFDQFLNQFHPIGMESSRFHQLIGEPDSRSFDERTRQTEETYITSKGTSVVFRLKDNRVFSYQTSDGPLVSGGAEQ